MFSESKDHLYVVADS